MKKIVTVCLLLLFSTQTHGVGKWRERIYRLLPFIAPKAYKLEKKVMSLSDLELVVLDLELRDHTENTDTAKEMAALARKEIYRRISRDEQVEILEILTPELTKWPDNILSNEKASSPQGHRGILQEFLSVNSGNIKALAPTPKHLQGLIGATQSIDTSIKILQQTLDREKGMDKFLEVFNAITANYPKPGSKHRDALDKFFTGNAERLEKLPFSAEQVERIDRYINKISTSIVLLEGGMNWARGDANKFFAAFKAVTWRSSHSEYRDALDEFFTKHTETIEKLSLSAKQIERITRYVPEESTAIALLRGSLKRAGGDAGKFFAFFEAVTWPSSLSSKYRDALDEFFTEHIETIEKLSLSAKQIERITRRIVKESTAIALLRGTLKRANGDAEKFFAAFKAVTWPNFPTSIYRGDLSSFFTGNAREIMELGLSTDQFEYINRYINKYPTSIKILELTLKRAKYAGDFFNVFRTIAPKSPNKESQQIYGHFLIDHAEAIVDLDPTTTQMEEINKYIPSPSTLFDVAKDRKRNKRENCAASVAALLEN